MKFSRKDLPKGDFSAHQIADIFYPECISQDKEGRVYNRAIPVVFRILRKMDLILEVGHGIFYNAE